MNKINILVVDDDESLIKVIADYLSKDNRFRVFSAINANGAVQIAKNNKIDLVIIDLKLPEMSGIELLSALQKDMPKIKSIIMTGHSDVVSYIESMESGAYEYLNKPVDLLLLKKVINKLL